MKKLIKRIVILIIIVGLIVGGLSAYMLIHSYTTGNDIESRSVDMEVFEKETGQVVQAELFAIFFFSMTPSVKQVYMYLHIIMYVYMLTQKKVDLHADDGTHLTPAGARASTSCLLSTKLCA